MNSIEEYGALFQKLGLSELEVEEGDFKLKLRKENGPKTIAGSVETDINNVIESLEPDSVRTDNTNEEYVGEPIKSPLLGIFYAANGDSKVVKEGDTVKEGDVLCTIEAMKMMNEVKSTKNGIISKVCAKEGDLVEYNQTLFMVKAC